jgi:simple sugar transport system permease protein
MKRNKSESGSSLMRAIKSGLLRIVPQLIAIVVAFLVGALVLIATGYSPVDVYTAMIMGAFGDVYGVGQTLTQATPIIFTALAFLFSFKCGLFNIGAEGQLIMGGFAAALIGISFSDLPAPIHILLALLAGALIGGLWGFLPAFLKARFGAHEVITTMMFSYIATYLTSYFVNYPFKAPGWVAETVPIADSAELPRILPPTQLSASIIIAIAMAGAVYYILQKTTLGYEVRASGLNPSAAENGGINVKRTMILAFILSGALAGLGGAGEVLGVHYRFIQGFSPGYGFDGLAVALVGGLNPVGVLLAGVLFGALRSGGMLMTRATHVPLDIVVIIQALVIVFVAAPNLIKYFLRWRKKA